MTRKLLMIPILAACAVGLMAGDAAAWPWSDDQVNQRSIKPQEATTPYPSRSVPMSGVYDQVADRDEAEGLKNPISASIVSVNKGRELFRIYCAACHGLTGRAESEVAVRGMPANDLTDEYVQDELTEGWIFGTITFGSAIMPPYGQAGDMNDEARGSNDLSVEERWHVVNYIRNRLVQDAVAAGPLPEEN